MKSVFSISCLFMFLTSSCCLMNYSEKDLVGTWKVEDSESSCTIIFNADNSGNYTFINKVNPDPLFSDSQNITYIIYPGNNSGEITVPFYSSNASFYFDDSNLFISDIGDSTFIGGKKYIKQ